MFRFLQRFFFGTVRHDHYSRSIIRHHPQSVKDLLSCHDMSHEWSILSLPSSKTKLNLPNLSEKKQLHFQQPHNTYCSFSSALAGQVFLMEWRMGKRSEKVWLTDDDDKKIPSFRIKRWMHSHWSARPATNSSEQLVT